jgi:hypothetical protein
MQPPLTSMRISSLGKGQGRAPDVRTTRRNMEISSNVADWSIPGIHNGKSPHSFITLTASKRSAFTFSSARPRGVA